MKNRKVIYEGNILISMCGNIWGAMIVYLTPENEIPEEYFNKIMKIKGADKRLAFHKKQRHVLIRWKTLNKTGKKYHYVGKTTRDGESIYWKKTSFDSVYIPWEELDYQKGWL